MRTSVRTEVFILLQRNIKAKTGLEEAVVNQATVWPESGADRAAASRKNPVLFPAPNQYNPNQIFLIGNGFGFFLPSTTIILKTADGGGLLPSAKRDHPP